MSRLRALLWRLGGAFSRRRRERDLAAELESHLQLHIDDAVRHGASPEEARRQALLALGGVDATKESVRDQATLRPLETLLQDLRFSLRTLRRTPGFTALVVLTFAIGIGANTAIFGLVNAVLLRPLPFPDDDRLVMLWGTDRRDGDHIRPVTPADYADWRAASRSYTGIAASSDRQFAITGDGEPENVIAYRFAPEMFPLLGVPPALGRAFTASDGAHVVVLSDALWRRRYRADPAVVGRSMLLDGEGYTVLGVMPPSFKQPRHVELWVPLVLDAETAASRSRTTLRLVARLAPGVTVESAGAELRAIAAGLGRDHPETNEHRGARLVSFREMDSGDVRPILLVLLGAVGFVLLLTCSNIAGLTLARGASRRREIAVRAALGAGRGRIVRQLLTESMLLAFAGGVVGLVLAWWATHLLVDLFPRHASNISMPLLESVPIDTTVLLWSFGAALLAGLLSGLVPALQTSRADLHRTLKEGARGSSGDGRLRPALVAAQIALAVVLMTGAGLLIRSTTRQLDALGFDPDGVLTARVLINKTRHPDEDQRRRTLDEILARLRAAPGVTAAGAVAFPPLCGWSSHTTFRDPARPDAGEREAAILAVDDGYFATLRVPVRRGRGFGDADRPGGPEVIIVDERFAREVLGDRDPIGVRLDFGTAEKPEMREIVGVVGNVLNEPPSDPARPTVYVDYAQSPWPIWGLTVRTNGDPGALAPFVRDAVRAWDADQPVSFVMTLDELVADALAAQRMSTWLLVFFAAVAVLLAALGLYGVLAHSVVERRQEIGIRMALGARRGDVVALLARRLMAIAGLGLALGVPAAWAAGRILQAMLQGVAARDPLVLAIIVGLCAIVTILAALLPLRRALRTDPMIALRVE